MYGFLVVSQNGRIKGEAKKALRAVIEKYGIPVTITANQVRTEAQASTKESLRLACVRVRLNYQKPSLVL